MSNPLSPKSEGVLRHVPTDDLASWGNVASRFPDGRRAGPESRSGDSVSAGRPPTRASDLSDAVPFAEAARLLGISVRTLYRLVAAGHLRPFYLPGSGRPRLPLSEVLRVRSHTRRPAGQDGGVASGREGR